MLKKLSYLLLIVTFLVGTGAFAQAGLRDKVQGDIDRTDQLIAQAEEQLQSTDNPAGQAFLEQAKVTQQQAKDAYAENHYVEAKRLTLLARDLLRKALKTDRATERGQDQTLRKLERAEEKLDRAKELVADSDDRLLASLVESATDNLKRAWDFYNTGKYIPAVRLAEQVERTADRILSAGPAGSTANYERRHETVREAIDQATQAVAECQSTEGTTLLEQAERAMDLAEQLAGNGRLPAALLALQRANTLANQAYRSCGGAESLTERYQRLQTQLEQLKERTHELTGNQKESVEALLVKAADQLELAKRALENGSTGKVSPALQAAQLALRQAEDIILERP